jgi:thiol peroxidase
MRKLVVKVSVFGHLTAAIVSMVIAGCVGMDVRNHEPAFKPTLQVGARLPDVPLMGSNGTVVRLSDTTGRIKLISIVPTLTTAISESQTRHLSEALSVLGGEIERVTVSTNSVEDQHRFVRQTSIFNMTIVSDAPTFAFGTTTGLLMPAPPRLHRAVIVADRDNVIRYFQLVPLTSLPDYGPLYRVLRQLAPRS